MIRLYKLCKNIWALRHISKVHKSGSYNFTKGKLTGKISLNFDIDYKESRFKQKQITKPDNLIEDFPILIGMEQQEKKVWYLTILNIPFRMPSSPSSLGFEFPPLKQTDKNEEQQNSKEVSLKIPVITILCSMVMTLILLLRGCPCLLWKRYRLFSSSFEIEREKKNAQNTNP